jgi:glycosyltransferase involved in cell wall biosynthesis
LAWWLDHKSCQVSSRVLTDTHAHARYLVDTFGVPETKIEPVYVGCDENLFQAQEPALSEREQFEVFYYGSFLPLHGTDVIIRAAVALRQRPQIHFTLGGHGPQYADIKAMIQKLDLDNVQLLGWIPFERLPEHIARASICLGGHFSTVPKAARVVSTKTYQFVSMAKPTIVGDNAATRELFSHGDHVYAVRMGDAKALAEAVAILVDDPDLRQRIALGGRQVYEQRLSTAAIARQLATVVEQACTKGAP